jgi:hypothetical protein
MTMQTAACEIIDEREPTKVEPPMDPIRFSDLKKGIIVPKEYFEPWLERFDWTWHQLSRNELPAPFETLEVFQNACICSDPLLWCTAYLREPEDPDHEEPYGFWDYQVESLRYLGHVVHKDAAEVGKTREIVALGLYLALTTPNGSGLQGAPMQGHLEEIIEAMDEQLNYNPELGNERWHRRIKDGWKKAPYHTFYFRNGFKLDFRPSGHDGQAYRGVHARTFAFKDEAAKDKNPKQWSEFWRALKPGCMARIYSTPDGDRSCEFYKLGVRASMNTVKQGPGIGRSRPTSQRVERADVPRPTGTTEEADIESFKDASKYVRDLKFRLFQWGKNLMPDPYWNTDRQRFYSEQYGGEDSPGYKHNVLGEDGDPEHTVFPWNQLRYCIKDIPEYRCMKVLVDAANNNVIVRGHRCNYIVNDNGPVPQVENLLDAAYSLSTFFDFNADNQSEFTRLIKSFFIATPGMKRGGADLGFSDDETEIGIKSIIGKRERLVARLYLKHVTYDQQCQAVNALDDLYGPAESIIWGTDFGNAGSAVAHDLQGLAIYKHKHYDDRLRGFMFQSTTDNVDEDGEEIFDGKTGKPVKITLKELATDLLVKKMQRQELEYPPDPDIVLYYTNHTVRTGGKQRIYKKEDDHLIDMDRAQILAKVLAADVEDLFA